MYCKNFSELSKHDAGTAGGKGASLGEMMNAGIPVPPGFVVLADAFEKFLQETDLNVEIDSILHGVDTKAMHTIEHASETIQKLILEARMPADIALEILENFQTLGTIYVAVRSSATAEDSASAAWAGQLDTFLNTTKDTLLKNVQRCFASLFTPRAIFYRFEQGLHESKISVAVVVQKMVESEVSGIAFSVHPVTEDYNQLIIEAGYGLGEAIVSGQITPDSYVVEKAPKRIIDVNVSEQERGIYRKSSNGENEWQSISVEKRNQQKLSNERILELSEIIIGIEKHYGFPCDIEWAFEGGKFYIVQSRPITTLSGGESDDSSHRNDSLASSSRENVVLSKIYTRERPLFYFSVFPDGERSGIRKYFDRDIEDILVIFPPQNRPGEVWYPKRLLEEIEFSGAEKMKRDPALTHQVIVDAEVAWEKLVPYLINDQPIRNIEEANRYYQFLVDFWKVLNTIFFFLVDKKELPREFSENLLNIRDKTQHYTAKMSTVFLNFIDSEHSDFSAVSSYMMPGEVSELSKADTAAALLIRLRNRVSEGCFVYRDTLYPLSQLEDISIRNNLVFEKGSLDASQIKGQVAYKGKAIGLVRNIRSRSDLGDVVSGDILVAPITDAHYIQAMQRSAAFVTDEGGVMSHAAIVAREMKKPCIIGTKIATQVLHDGDLVEVDANVGVVRILERVDESGGDISKSSMVKHDTQHGSVNQKYYRDIPFTIMGRYVTYPLDTEVWHTKATSDYFEELFGVWREMLAVHVFDSEYYMYICTPRSFRERLHVRISELTAKNPKSMEEIFFKFYDEKKKAENTLPRVDASKLSQMTDDELIATYEKNRSITHRIVAFDQFTWLAEDYWMSRMEEVLVKRLTLKKDSPEYTDTLFTLIKPREISTTLQEKRAVIDAALKIRSGKILREVATNDLARDFGWMPVMAYGNPWDGSHYREELDLLLGHDEKSLRKEFLDLTEYTRLRDEDFERVISKYAIAPEDAQIFIDFGLAIDVRNESEYIASLAGFHVMSIYDEISKRLHLSILELRTLCESEVIESLRGETNPHDILAKKGHIVAWGLEGVTRSRIDFSPEEGEAVLRYLLVQEESHSVDSKEEIHRGVTASRGKVVGRAKLVPTPDDNGKVMDGDVMIAYATMTDNLSAMKRAVAVVTEVGGLTCHAAVVSREFGIPCIVNLKNAMTDFCDGDLVEVDAENGVVRILERTSKEERNNTIVLKKNYSRDLSLILEQLWVSGFKRMMLKYPDYKNPYEPYVIFFVNGENMEIWENERAIHFFQNWLLEKNKQGTTFLQEIIHEYEGLVSALENYWRDGGVSDHTVLKKYLEISERAAGLFFVWYYTGTDDRTPEVVLKLARGLRAKDEFFAKNDKYIKESVTALGGKVELANLIFLSEFPGIPSEEVLRQRISGIVVVDGDKQYLFPLVRFAEDHPEYEFEDLQSVIVEVDEFPGQSAQKGKTKGIVRIVKNQRHMERVHAGDIIVSPMTTPDFLPAMQKAIAFITDEGGITCHAAIVAREMKKPCIIGTKIATQVLRDGDLVEVDADNGVVRILEKVKS